MRLLWPPDPRLAIGISPRVDIVVRELIGTPGHEPLLIDLLIDLRNEVLRWPAPIVGVQLLPDAILPEEPDQKGIILDVQARGR